MKNITRLVGDDGLILVGDPGDEFTGDAAQSLDELAGGAVDSNEGQGFYQITAVGETTGFDWTNPEVGDYFFDDGSLVLGIGDKAVPLPDYRTPKGALKDFNIDVSKAEYDLTVLKDKNKTYRFGSKADFSGSMNATMEIGDYFFLDKFMDRLHVSEAMARTMTRKNNRPFYFIGFLQAEEIPGETLVAVVGRVEAGSYKVGAQGGSNQDYTVNFKPTSGDRMQLVVIDIPEA